MSADKLGRYVVTREEAARAVRYFWAVPDGLRPEGWPLLVELPMKFGSRPRGSCLTLEQKVVLDARRLNADLDLEVASNQRGDTLAHLASRWMKMKRWTRRTKESSKCAKYHINLILRWSADMGWPPISHVTLSDCEDFLEQYDDREALQLQLRSALNVLFKRAIGERFILTNPMVPITWYAPVTETAVWHEDDVRRFMEVAYRQEQPGLAGIIFMMWCTSQRAQDVRAFRHDIEYRKNHLIFSQTKTERKMMVAVVPELQRVIARARTNSSFLFTDGRTGRPFTAERLSVLFSETRSLAQREDRPKLYLRALRHSCVMRLARRGCTVPMIAGLTGHKIASVQRMIEHYFGADGDLTRLAQAVDIRGGGHDESEMPAPIPRFDVLANDNNWSIQPAKLDLETRRQRFG